MATAMTEHLQELTAVLKDITVGRASHQQTLQQSVKSKKRSASKVYLLRYPRNSPHLMKPKSL